MTVHHSSTRSTFAVPMIVNVGVTFVLMGGIPERLSLTFQNGGPKFHQHLCN